METWGEYLSGVTDDELVHGLFSLPADFPPTVLQFKQLCKLYATASHRPFERNADKKRIQQDRDKSVGRAALEAMKNKS